MNERERELLEELRRTTLTALVRNDATILPYEVKQYIERWGHDNRARVEQAEARAMGKLKGVRFRAYTRWKPFPIKSYGPGAAEHQDFRNWREAREWVWGL